MRERTNDLAFQYAKTHFAEEDGLLKKIQQEAEKINLGGMSLNPVEAKTLFLLIRLCHVKTVVEVGTFLGYSALWMARALPKDGRLYTLEKDAERAKQARFFLDQDPCGAKIEILQGDAVENLKKLNGPFDMVFIDADKPSYFSYLEWADANTQKGSLIVGDNTFLFGAVYGEPRKSNSHTDATTQIMRRFNEYLADKERFDSLLVPNEEGMTIALKK